MDDITSILDAMERGEILDSGQLLPAVYDELRRLAAAKLAREAPGHTLQATALVHEAWLRLGGDDASKFANRADFLGAAAEAMRRILVESARRKKRVRHGGELERVAVDAVDLTKPMPGGGRDFLHASNLIAPSRQSAVITSPSLNLPSRISSDRWSSR